MATNDQPVHSVAQGVTKVAGGVVTAMGASPLSLALLLVNVAFLAFAAYILGEVAENARERNKTQNELIVSLVSTVRECRQEPAKSPTLWRPPFLPRDIAR